MNKLVFLLFGILPPLLFAQSTVPISLGSSTFDQMRSIEIDAEGNKYITGIFSGTVDFDLSPDNHELSASGSADVFIAKYDSINELEWVLGLGGNDYDYVNDLILADQSVYIAGYYSSSSILYNNNGTIENINSFGGQDLFLLKINAQGTLEWLNVMGSTQNDQIKALSKDSNQNVIVAGNYRGVIDLDPDLNNSETFTSVDGQDCFISTYDEDGIFVSALALGGNGLEDINDIEIDLNNNKIYLVGYFDSDMLFNGTSYTSNGSFDLFIAEIDQNQNESWFHTAGGTLSDQSTSLTIDNNELIVTGRFNDSFDFGAGNIITSSGFYDSFLCKFSVTGNLIDVVDINGSGQVEADVVKVNDQGAIYLGGTFSSDISDPNTQLASQGSDDMFILKFDNNLIFEAAYEFGSAASEGLSDMHILNEGSTWISGFFQNTISFGSSPNLTVSSNGSSDGIVFYLEGTSYASLPNESVENLKIYPNPAEHFFSIDLHYNTSDIKIINSMFQTVIEKNNYQSGEAINIDALEPGVYYVVLEFRLNKQPIKFIKK